jgi:hypothetical protein
MDRETFVETCCIAMVRPTHVSDRKSHCEIVRGTAEALADELGLSGESLSDVKKDRDDMHDSLAKMTILAAERARRIAELEADLDKATAPKGRRP